MWSLPDTIFIEYHASSSNILEPVFSLFCGESRMAQSLVIGVNLSTGIKFLDLVSRKNYLQS